MVGLRHNLGILITNSLSNSSTIVVSILITIFIYFYINQILITIFNQILYYYYTKLIIIDYLIKHTIYKNDNNIVFFSSIFY